MALIKDLVGQQFGRLTVIRLDGKTSNGNAKWLCRCDCGNLKSVGSYALRSGNTQSCGCIQQEQRTLGPKTHGESKASLYKLWGGMRVRCNERFAEKYPIYSGRGIKVCDEWSKYEAFRDWALSHGYHEGLTIDRIDVNGDYEPTNCRFITLKEQQNNRRNNHLLTFRGKTQTMSQWADEVGLKYKCLEHRINRGWSVDDALTVPMGGRRCGV